MSTIRIIEAQTQSNSLEHTIELFNMNNKNFGRIKEKWHFKVYKLFSEMLNNYSFSLHNNKKKTITNLNERKFLFLTF